MNSFISIRQAAALLGMTYTGYKTWYSRYGRHLKPEFHLRIAGSARGVRVDVQAMIQAVRDAERQLIERKQSHE